MGQILVRKVDDSLKRKLKRRAERHGHSMEEEVRAILRDALKDEDKPEKGLGSKIAERFRGLELDRDIEELRGYTIEPPDFST